VSAGNDVLVSCLCHHGCGPGIDGTLDLVVTNTDAVDHTIVVTDVTLDPIGTPGGPFIATRDGTFRVVGTGDDTIVASAGTTTTATVMVYLDLPMSLPGTYRVVVAARVDGGSASFVIAASSVPMGGGCE
jgi:hypothetical protein